MKTMNEQLTDLVQKFLSEQSSPIEHRLARLEEENKTLQKQCGELQSYKEVFPQLQRTLPLLTAFLQDADGYANRIENLEAKVAHIETLSKPLTQLPELLRQLQNLTASVERLCAVSATSTSKPSSKDVQVNCDVPKSDAPKRQESPDKSLPIPRQTIRMGA